MDNNIIYLGFADNKVPEFKEVKSKEYIYFGSDNKFEGTKLTKVNRRNESLNNILIKVISDIEVFGGFYLEVIWNKLGSGFEVFHMPFNCLRRSKDELGWFYKKDWTDYKEKEKFIPDYDSEKKTGAQIFAYKEYRVGNDIYALPSYMAALNDIETDVEISKYNLSTIKNGMFGGKMVTLLKMR